LAPGLRIVGGGSLGMGSDSEEGKAPDSDSELELEPSAANEAFNEANEERKAPDSDSDASVGTVDSFGTVVVGRGSFADGSAESESDGTDNSEYEANVWDRTLRGSFNSSSSRPGSRPGSGMGEPALFSPK
jgi:hypothetical protein